MVMFGVSPDLWSSIGVWVMIGSHSILKRTKTSVDCGPLWKHDRLPKRKCSINPSDCHSWSIYYISNSRRVGSIDLVFHHEPSVCTRSWLTRLHISSWQPVVGMNFCLQRKRPHLGFLPIFPGPPPKKVSTSEFHFQPSELFPLVDMRIYEATFIELSSETPKFLHAQP